MKAIIHTRYGPPKEVLTLSEVEKPIPKDNEVLVKVHAASLNAIDKIVVEGKSFFIRLTTLGIRKPSHKILGDDIAGVVEDVGKNVTKFKPGDEVFGISNWGGFAEYKSVPENRIIHKPTNISFEEAAAVPIAAITALQGLQKHGKVQSGEKVLINGASGGTGTFAVQIAKALGTNVTGVCSTSKIEMVKSIGADHVFDYTKENFIKSGESYDLILDFAAYRSVRDFKRVLNPKGRYICIGGSMTRFFQALLIGPLISIIGSKKLTAKIPIPKHEDFVQIKEFLETGKVVPVIDKCYPLNKTAEAIQYYIDGHAQGKIVITIGNDTKA
ncbi:MAG: NAD(P)-dependent alcohol dehydrogenase [Candidatus Hodarchaeales archaeon]|jgi:NADPH:quinone reductase-like Zn-dependent oxidoreductase